MSTITLSPAALTHLKNNMDSCPPNTVGIRIGLQDAGCSGFSYTMDFTAEQSAEDQVFEFEGIKILMNPEVFKFLKGTEITLAQDGVNSVLEFNNPNVVNACGCGESFQFKEATD
jgi:iron-sulfur cluster assembly protein